MPKNSPPVVATGHNLDYARLFQVLPERYILFEATKPYRFVNVSEAHSRMTGIPRSRMIGKPFFEIFPDVSDETSRSGKSALEDVFLQVRTSGKPHTLEKFHYDIPNATGNFSERYWKPTHYPLFDENGTVTHILQTVTDVTSEVVSERRSAHVRMQLEEALSVGFVGTWDWNIANNIVTADANLARFFGVPVTGARAGLPLEVFTTSIHPSDRERVVAAIQRAVAKHSRLNEEYRTIDSTGTIHWVLARGRTHKDETGAAVFFSGIIVDITQRKHAEEILSYQRLITESIDDAIITMDLDGKVTAWNPGASKLFGYTEAEVVGKPSEDYLKIDSVCDRDVIRANAYAGNSWRGNLRYKHREGHTIAVMASVSALRDNSGAAIGLVTVMQDLTDIHKAQADAEQAREKSRRARQEAVLLKRQNEDLVALSRTKDEFIALTSHQLRTPATGTKQYLGMLLEGYAEPLGPRQRSFAQSAYDCNERQLRVVDDILRVAQIDLDKVVLRPEPTDIALFVRQIVDEQSGKFAKRDHHFRLDNPIAPVVVLLDRDRLRMALENIFDNADKYTEPGKQIAIRVSAQAATVEIAVADEGVGISPDDFPKLFHKFSRIDNPLSIEVGGSGLGLYWSQRIISMHGGTITVESQLGNGTTFVISLPLRPVQPMPAKRSSKVRSRQPSLD